MQSIKLTCLTGLVAVAIAMAGPLNPPNGPVAPSFKTLSDVEPRTAVQSLAGDSTAQYVITLSGSYYLAGGITGVAGKKGISVRADDVTIDLRGQTMDGTNAGTIGISLDSPGARGLCIRDGTLSNWTINCVANPGESGRLDSIRTLGPGQGTALFVGAGSILLNCSVNGAGGIHTGDSCLVEGCTVQGSNVGLQVSDGCGVHDCMIGGSGSANSGYAALGCGSGCTVTACTVRGGPYWGVLGWDDCTISRCMAHSNAGGGIGVRFGGLIRSCFAQNNQNAAIEAAPSVLVGSGSGLGTLIEDCNAGAYNGEGIRVRSNCSIVRNLVSGVGAIHTTGSGNRIDGNVSMEGATVVVDGTSNLLVRHNCYNPTDLHVAAGNLNAAINNAVTNPPYPYPWSNFGD